MCLPLGIISVSVCYVAVRTIVLSRHIVDFLGYCRMETAPTSIEVLLCPTLGQSDEPSDLRGSLSLSQGLYLYKSVVKLYSIFHQFIINNVYF